MGHDIEAIKEIYDKSKLAESIKNAEPGTNTYNMFMEATRIAELRRTALDPLNQAIYIALGVIDDAYCGSSGNGVTIEFNKEQLSTALEILKSKDFSELQRERNAADDFAGMLMSVGAIIDVPELDTTVDDEINFIDKCIAFINETGVDSVPIYFC